MDDWQNLDDTFDGLNSFIKLSSRRPDAIDFGRYPLESYWLTLVSNPDRAAEFLRTNGVRIQKLAERMASTDALTTSALEEALLQHDVVQTFFVFYEADRALGQTHHDTLLALAVLVRKLLLTSSEYQQLQEVYPTVVPKSHFAAIDAFESDADYLPEAVLGSNTDWFPIFLSMTSHEHHTRFQGRSFFSTYVKLPGVSRELFYEFKQYVESRLGRSLNAAGDVPPCPGLN